MKSRAQVALGTFIVVVGLVMGVFMTDGFTDVTGVLTATAHAVAGLLFILAGVGRSFDVAGSRVDYRQFVGIASLLIAVTFVPSVWEAFGGGSGDVAYGVASGVGAVGLLVLGILFLTGRVEQKA